MPGGPMNTISIISAERVFFRTAKPALMKIATCAAVLAVPLFGLRAQTNCAPAPSGIVAWWPFQSNAVDIVGGHNGTLTGNVSFASAEVGLGLSITGAPGGVIVSDSADLNFGPGVDFSIEAWIRPLPANTTFDALNIVDKRLTPNDASAIGYVF